MHAMLNAARQGFGSSIDHRECQRRVDAIQAAAREQPPRLSLFRPSPSPVEPLAPSTDPYDQRLAEELEYAGRVLEAMGDMLAGDPVILQRHMQAMQGFDMIGQIIGHLAKVIQADDKAAAIDRIGMREMRARLTRRTL